MNLKMTAEQVQFLINKLPDSEKEKLSDWYHTFWELYKHRIHLLISLCKQLLIRNGMKHNAWLFKLLKSKIHSDWTEFEWWFIIQLEIPDWQISYHLPNEYRDTCYFITTVEKANERDWHTSDDVLDKLLEI